MKFLLSRRWITFAVVVLFLAAVAWFLGRWQFHRLDERQQTNTLVRENLHAASIPAQDLLSTDRPVDLKNEWRSVTLSGRWDTKRTIVVKYQTSVDDEPGVDLVNPLILDNGKAVIVNRGWMSSANTGSQRPKIPRVQTGRVFVTGWVRRDATGRAATVTDLSTRAISSKEIGRVVPYPVYRGVILQQLQAPRPLTPLGQLELPDDSNNGPHFFYGLQWWFFGGLALVGFVYLVWDEFRQARRRRRSESKPASAQQLD